MSTDREKKGRDLIAIKDYSLRREGARQLSPSFKVREFGCTGSDVILIDDELVVPLHHM